MVKLMVGTTLEITMPSTSSGFTLSCANMFISRMPYSSDVFDRLVEMRQ